MGKPPFLFKQVFLDFVFFPYLSSTESFHLQTENTP